MLHSLTIATGALDAGTTITGIGAGETIRAIAVSGPRAWVHTGNYLYTLDTGTAVATVVGSEITDDDDQVEAMAFVGSEAHAVLGDGRYATLNTTTGVVTATGESSTSEGSITAACAPSYPENEDDARLILLDSDGLLSMYDTAISAAVLWYAVYVGGNHARLIQDLIQASEDRTNQSVRIRIIPRPAGVRARVRVI